jgi:tRNA 2-selenouridine synthase
MPSVDLVSFLELAKSYPVFDVRSPAEYQHAHLPGAISLPLFSDAERALVGTAYKQQSRDMAIKIGLDFFGPKMRGMVEEVEQIANSNTKTVLVHCWRGGMRSNAVAWLLSTYGFNVHLLVGGYKNYRTWALEQFNLNHNLQIIGGFTGSGKTKILHDLQQQGHAVIDLEGLAQHKGSALGGIGQPPQPSQEQFENLLALALYQNTGQTILLEDESQRIGNRQIPMGIWNQMRKSTLYFFDIPFDIRLAYLVEEYGHLPSQSIADAVLRIQKRLGGLATKQVSQAVLSGDLNTAFALLLAYYDRYYALGRNSRPPAQVIEIQATTVAPSHLLLNILKK